MSSINLVPLHSRSPEAFLNASKARIDKISWSGPLGPNESYHYRPITNHSTGEIDTFLTALLSEKFDFRGRQSTSCYGAVLLVMLDTGLVTPERLKKIFDHSQNAACTASELCNWVETGGKFEDFNLEEACERRAVNIDYFKTAIQQNKEAWTYGNKNHFEFSKGALQFRSFFNGINDFLGLDKALPLVIEESTDLTSKRVSLPKPGDLLLRKGFTREGGLIHVAIATGETDLFGYTKAYSLEADSGWGLKEFHQVDLFPQVFDKHVMVSRFENIGL